mmetsp:Transcript_54835/g.178167  ORF Transcript_54835/g.178167 Transcript_54835/m.178167 type:complete len:93 (+) Transcript_54835:698-976(+)
MRLVQRRLPLLLLHLPRLQHPPRPLMLHLLQRLQLTMRRLQLHLRLLLLVAVLARDKAPVGAVAFHPLLYFSVTSGPFLDCMVTCLSVTFTM